MRSFITKTLFKKQKFSFSLIKDEPSIRRIKKHNKSQTIYNPSEDKLQELTIQQKQENIITQFVFPTLIDKIRIFEYKQKQLENKNIQYPRNCFVKLVIPFKSDEKVKNEHQRFESTNVRFGKLLEIFDITCARVAYLYTYDQFKEFTNVTACVDNIHFFDQISVDQDMIVQAYPTHAGTSSIEIRIDVFQQDTAQPINTADTTTELKLTTTALFLFVAREPKDHKKSKKIPELSFDGEEKTQNMGQQMCQIRQTFGQMNKIKRIEQFKQAQMINPPTVEEIAQVHQFFLDNENYKNNNLWKKMEQTKIQKNLLMHRQDQNMHGKIFGGYLMKEASEIGWLSAYLHAKVFPLIYFIDDFQFFQPVDIGNIMLFEATVGYVEKNFIQVHVACMKREHDDKLIKANDLHLTFLINQPIEQQNQQLKQVYPVSYAESLIYLDSKKRLFKQLTQ